ncbi:MAG: M50 family metallopeptidase [Planctomycetes bacterium]|jgi:hypothetical protein|nr:M50 family metallopeptidase [Planctomycetota bacterium]
MTARTRQVLLLATFLPWCWLMMMVVHELGHVLAAWMTGGTVERVVLHPWAISRTDLSHNPQPLSVSWAGAVVGSVVPVLVWLIAQASRIPLAPFTRFFAGFCLVTNGVYLGMGAWTGDGDAGDLIAAGAAVWQLVLFGVGALASGLWLWHGLGPAFGFSGRQEAITHRSVIISMFLLLVTVSLECWLSPR